MKQLQAQGEIGRSFLNSNGRMVLASLQKREKGIMNKKCKA